MRRLFISVLTSTAILFLWSGMTQMFPWGVPTAQNVNVQTIEHTKQSETPDIIRLEPYSLTTDQFESQFINKVSIYSTDNTYSWIITNPIRDDYSGYFIHEFITQLLVGLLLSLVLLLTVTMNQKTRLVLIGLMGLCAVAGSYGQLINWWELPFNYGLGVGLNLILGWLLAGFVVSQFILKSLIVPSIKQIQS